MKESHTIAMPVQHAQPHLQPAFNPASIDGPVMKGEWSSTPERFLKTFRNGIRRDLGHALLFDWFSSIRIRSCFQVSEQFVSNQIAWFEAVFDDHPVGQLEDA